MRSNSARSGSDSNSGGTTVPHSTTGRRLWWIIAAIRSHVDRNGRCSAASSRSPATHSTSCSSTTNRSASSVARRRWIVDLPVPLGPVTQSSGRRRNGHRWPQWAHRMTASGSTCGRSARSPQRSQISRFTRAGQSKSWSKMLRLRFLP